MITLKKVYKYRIYPTKFQETYLSRVFGSCRWLYNHFLHLSIVRYNHHLLLPTVIPKPSLKAFDWCNELPLLKKEVETAWLSEIPAQVLQQVTGHLQKAFQCFFKEKKGYPKFKKRHSKQTAHYPNQSYRIKDNQLFLAKLDTPIKVIWDRPLPPGKVTGCTVSKTPSGKYFASFICEVTPQKTDGQGFLGIDAGITDLFYFSTGEKITNPVSTPEPNLD